MEYVAGTSLDRLLRGGRHLDKRGALTVAVGVAQALSHLHSVGMLHRDVKPENILIALDPSRTNAEQLEPGEFTADRVRLTDFGLARPVDQSASLAITRESSLLGSPLYMSPEQFANGPELDGRADLYSLGATLFHMLTGQAPFPTGSILERLHPCF